VEDSRINNKWPVAKEGVPFIVISGSLTLLFVCTNFFFISILAGVVLFFVIFFFRDPKRSPTSDSSDAVLTPADGTILEVLHLKGTNNPLGRASIKISIFMSVFNVHVNRIPIGGTIEKITYHPGKFFSANLDKASKQNEKNEIVLQTAGAKKIVFIQIAGLIARRIACWIEKGDRVNAGQRFGLIRFGSRLEVYMPEGSKTTIQVRQKVKAGETVIGYL
jgi:phosphatidylserine decarboxylase